MMQLGGHFGVAVVVSVSKIRAITPALFFFVLFYLGFSVSAHTTEWVHLSGKSVIGAARNQQAQKWTENIKYPSVGKECSPLQFGVSFPYNLGVKFCR